MSDLAVFVLVAWFMAAVATSVGCVAVIRSLNRANRVVPDQPSAAPVNWLWSWRSGPRLHRRLQRAVGVATTVVATFRPGRSGARARRGGAPGWHGGGQGWQGGGQAWLGGPGRLSHRPEPTGMSLPAPMAEVADALLLRAGHIDQRLVVAARAPARWRGAVFAELRAEIAEIEAAVLRLGRLVTTWQAHLQHATGTAAPTPLDVHDRLAALEAALAELAPLHATGTRL